MYKAHIVWTGWHQVIVGTYSVHSITFSPEMMGHVIIVYDVNGTKHEIPVRDIIKWQDFNA